MLGRSVSVVLGIALSLLPMCVTAESREQKFNVGLILPLSGALADYGAALRHGFELAQEDEPELFSHIALHYEDSRYEEKTALSAFYALEQKGGINLYHIWGVSPNASVLPVANQKKRPVVSETSMISAAKDRPYVVRASRTGYGVAERLTEEFVKRGWWHVGVIITQIPYYTDIADALVELGNKQHIQVDLLDQVVPTEQDFRSSLLRLKARDLDAIGPLLLGDQIMTFCSQAKGINYAKPMFGAHIHNSVELMKQCLPLSDNAIFPGVIVSKDFRDRYAARFHDQLRIDSAAGSYETALIIARLFGNSTSALLSPEAVIDQFKKVRRAQSSIGGFEYTDTAQGGKVIVFTEILLTFREGQIVPLR